MKKLKITTPKVRLRPKPEKTFAVIGGGSWATALVKILMEGDVEIHWWTRDKRVIQELQETGHNPNYLSSVKIDPEKVFPTTDLAGAIKKCRHIVLVVPAAFVGSVLERLSPSDFVGKYVITSIKGMVPKRNILVSELINSDFHVPHRRIACIGGPCHAEEVAMEKQAYLTIGSRGQIFGQRLAKQIECRFITASSSRDIGGIEYSAVMKNIFAVACGIAHGLHYGDNFQAVLVSNAVQETKRFLKAIYGNQPRDLSRSSYLGDLLVTTYSQFSRNRTFGNMVGRGYSVKAAQMEMSMVAEGYYAAKSIYDINKGFNVKLPIVTAVYHVLYENISPTIEFKILVEKLR